VRHHALPIVRYGVPAVTTLAAIVVIVVRPDETGFEVMCMLLGSALAILLLNALHRIGVEGDSERDREEAARRYFDEHGRWPDERPRGGASA
jgi:hypothetical protein